MAELTCTVVTPQQTVFEMKASFVSVTLVDGEIGIAPLHTPLLGRVAPGRLHIYPTKDAGDDATEVICYVEGGFVEVMDDEVTILTGRVVQAEEIDPEQVDGLLTEALAMPADTPEKMAVRDRTVAQRRAQLRVVRHVKPLI